MGAGMTFLEVYEDGRLIGSWDDTTRTYTDHRTGQSRPYTAEENTAADARAAQTQAQANVTSTSTKLITVDFPAMQAILSQTNADLRADPSQEIKDLARAVRRLTRRVENLTDGSE